MDQYFYVPVDPVDLLSVCEDLRAADVFTPTFSAGVDIYDPTLYLREAHLFATDTAMRVDRNVFTRIVAIARGDLSSDPRGQAVQRLAAGVLAFAQCAEIVIEPNIALYEVAQKQGQSAAVEELRLFRRVDELHPGYWTEIAVGRSRELGALPPELPPRGNDARADFTMPLRRWRRNYILCLKLAELELGSGSATQRMRAFMRWAYHDFLVGGPALAFAAHYLAPNAPRKRLLKGLRSTDRERALEGVRNAAWDLTLVSQWLLDIQAQEARARLVLLTSFDAGVHKLARAVALLGDTGGAAVNPLRVSLCDLWGGKVGSDLAAEIEAQYESLDSSERRVNTPDVDSIDEYINHGEAAIRGWRP